jgi:catechol 2,3-dioxygenase-like lactoylglutathione lyase family enzyme
LVRYLALNVSDLDKSIAFYSRGLGMKELRRFQSPDGAPIVAIGYAGADSSDKYDQLQPASLLLTIGKEPVRQVAGFRLVLQTPDIRRLFDDLAKVIPASGGKIIMAPKLDPYAPALTVGLAEDPSGYQLEIMQRN